MEAGTAGTPRFAERGDGVSRDADPTAPTVIQFPKVADPGPLGLAAFALTTFVLSVPGCVGGVVSGVGVMAVAVLE